MLTDCRLGATDKATRQYELINDGRRQWGQGSRGCGSSGLTRVDAVGSAGVGGSAAGGGGGNSGALLAAGGRGGGGGGSSLGCMELALIHLQEWRRVGWVVGGGWVGGWVGWWRQRPWRFTWYQLLFGSTPSVIV